MRGVNVAISVFSAEFGIFLKLPAESANYASSFLSALESEAGTNCLPAIL
jgi:hypothetical protein